MRNPAKMFHNILFLNVKKKILPNTNLKFHKVEYINSWQRLGTGNNKN